MTRQKILMLLWLTYIRFSDDGRNNLLCQCLTCFFCIKPFVKTHRNPVILVLDRADTYYEEENS